MRTFQKSACLFAAAAFAAFAVGHIAFPPSAEAKEEDDDDDADDAATKKLAEEAMAKAVARGKEIWNNKDGTMKKSCASCHDDANKPNLDLKTRVYSYPAYHKRKKAIITMHQKLQDMVVQQCRGPALDDKGSDIGALEAYVASLRKK